MRLKVTATDLDTGETAETVISEGNYVVIVADPCRVENEQHHANGTSVITLKGRHADLLTTKYVPPTNPGGAA